MNEPNKDKNEIETDLKSAPSDGPVSDNRNNEQTSDSTTTNPKEPADAPPNSIAEAPGDTDDHQKVAEDPEEGKDSDEKAVADNADRQTEVDSHTAEAAKEVTDNQNQKHVSENHEHSEDTNTTQKSAQIVEESKLVDPELKDQGPSETDLSADDRLSADNEPGPAETSKEKQASEENLDHKGEDDDPTNAASRDSSAPVATENSEKYEGQESAEEKQEDTMDDNASRASFEQQLKDVEENTEDLPGLEGDEKSHKKIRLVKAALTVMVVSAVFSGFFIFENKSNPKSAQRSKTKEADHAISPKASHKKTHPSIQPDDPNYIYHAKIEEISMLRETLLHKKEEILELKKQYQEGIEELEKEILDQLRRPHIIPFLQAIENKHVEFRLRTIQRRQAYIRQLDRPAEWIFQACEELLYIKRRALMDIQVAEVASGIDMNMHVRHMNTALNKYSPTADKLAVDLTDAQPESLEAIWQRIQSKSLGTSSQVAHSRNQVISEQICNGNFNRLTELSEVSVDSAKCIVEMQGSELFLNGITEISPSAARHLFQWKGNWICLNGFRVLSPRVAAYLFAWEGSWISLNGLTEFPPEIGNMLLQWEGNQLELMSLRYSGGSDGKIGFKYLAQWERSGGKLFVPKTIRKKIDEINGNPA